MFRKVAMSWLTDKTLSEIVTKGAFGGNNCSLVSFERDNSTTGRDNNYKSSVIFGSIVTSNGTNYSVLFKIKHQDEVMRKIMKSDVQFHNEILMYERIIPYLLTFCDPLISHAGRPLLPRYFYGRNKCGEESEKDFIILENAVPLGFRLSEQRPFLDYDHLVCAIQAIAKLHGLSYIAKHKDPVGFQGMIAEIQDTQWNADGQWKIPGDALRVFGKRGLDRLLERDADKYRDHVHFQRFSELVNAGDQSLRRLMEAREPLSVLCHGEVCRDNVLFRYGITGRPIETLFFDLATARYGSPALDLSVLLYFNTTQHLRVARWDDLLGAYCTALAAAVPDNIRAPDRCELDAEMASSALYGFAQVAFFLLRQFGSCTGPPGAVTAEDYRAEHYSSVGGETGTELITDIVQHFVEMGYTNI